jgi:hypothetical protein
MIKGEHSQGAAASSPTARSAGDGPERGERAKRFPLRDAGAAAALRRMTYVPLLALLTAAGGCGGTADDAAPPAAEPAPAESAGESAEPIALTVTAEDSAIFTRTIDWAREQRLDTLPIGAMMAAIGQRFVGAPYEPGTLDPPGPERLVVNLRTFDCVTFVESTLALARLLRAGEATFDAFTRELLRIRYRDGVPPTYPARLHYFSDWIASNEDKGLVENVTAELGGVVDPEAIAFMSGHRASYRQLADTANLRAIEQREAELSAAERVYIPEDRIANVAADIRDGDIIAATSTLEGLDIAHTGLALWIDGALHLMHAPLVGSVVEISEIPLADRIQRIDGQDGVMVARPQ